MARGDGKAQFREIFAKIRGAVNDLDLSVLPEIGELVSSRIRAVARTGKTMASGQATKMPALSASYVKDRKRWRARGEKVGDVFSPARSNLTASGQYLDSIKTTKIDKAKAEVVVGATGKRTGESLTNQKLAEYLSEQGRSIWGIDAITRRRIVSMVKADIRNRIRKTLLKK